MATNYLPDQEWAVGSSVTDTILDQLWGSLLGEYGIRPTHLNTIFFADQYADITTALAAIPTTGGTLYVPNGTYTTTATLTIPYDNITIMGESRDGAIIKFADDSAGNQDLIDTNSKSGIRIMSITADGNRGSLSDAVGSDYDELNTNYACINLVSGTVGARVENVKVIDGWNLCLRGVMSDFTEAGYNVNHYYIRDVVAYCTALVPATGVNSGLSATNQRIRDLVQFVGEGGNRDQLILDGMELYMGDTRVKNDGLVIFSVRNFMVSNVHVLGNQTGGTGIICDSNDSSCINGTISNCVVDSPGRSGFHFVTQHDSSGGGYYSQAAITVNNCVATRCGQSGFRVKGLSGVTFNGCTATDNGRAASGTDTAGFYVYDQTNTRSKYVVINGCWSGNSPTAAGTTVVDTTQTHGVLTEDNTDYILITSNVLHKNATAGTSYVGSNNTDDNNMVISP